MVGQGRGSVVFEFEGDPYEVDEAATGIVAWLNDDDDLRGTAEVRMAPVADGEMGGLADAAQAALGAWKPLAKSFGSWLIERVRSKGSVKLSITREGRGSFTVEASSVGEIEALMPRVYEFFA